MAGILVWILIVVPVPKTQSKTYLFESKRLQRILSKWPVEKFTDEVKVLSLEPSVLTTSVLPYIVDEFEKEKMPCRHDPDFVQSPSGHNLNQRRGRAAYIVEKLSGKKLPQVVPSADADVYRRCRTATIEAVSAALVEVHTKSRSVLSNMEAIDQFKGLIVPLRTNLKLPTYPSNALNELLSKWDPIGKDVAGFEAIIGRRLTRNETELGSYIFYTTTVSGSSWSSPARDGFVFTIAVLEDSSGRIVSIASRN